MKRKVLKQSNDATFLTEKIDDAVRALNRNEEELSSVLTELMSRNLSEAERSSIMNSYASYSKSVNTVKKIIGN